MADYNISSKLGVLYLTGELHSNAVRAFCNELYKNKRAGFSKITLDFTKATKVFESFMTPIIPIVKTDIKNKIDFDLFLPEDPLLEKLFQNTNWAHHICPRFYEESLYKKTSHLPCLQFQDSDEQHKIVNQVMDIILGSLSLPDRGALSALEWAVNEVTDNVLNHAHSSIGGFIQATTYSKSNRIEVIIADAGIGIPESMNNGTTQEEAVRRSIEEGVTRNKETNQGNGLYGTFQVAWHSQGEFEINSMNALLNLEGGEVKTRNLSVPFEGTSVRFVINCNEPDLLKKALKFKGQPYTPAHDFIEAKHELDNSEDVLIKISEYKETLGSRESGKKLHTRILNLYNSCPVSNKVLIDFGNVYVLSSSVADEVFGRLFTALGPMEFMSRIQIINADPTVRGLIDRSIMLRMKSD